MSQNLHVVRPKYHVVRRVVVRPANHVVRKLVVRRLGNDVVRRVGIVVRRLGTVVRGLGNDVVRPTNRNH